MDDSQIARGGPRNTTRDTIKKDLEINEFDRDMIYEEHNGIV